MSIKTANPFPKRVRVQAVNVAAAGRVEGLAVCLTFAMSYKNNFNFIMFLDSNGGAQVCEKELLDSFDKERSDFIMDYGDPRTAFAGVVTAKVLSAVEIQGVLKTFHEFRNYLFYPNNYESRLNASMLCDRPPDNWELKVQAEY